MKKGLLFTLLFGVAVLGATQWLVPTAKNVEQDKNEYANESENEESGRLPLQQRIEGAINYLNNLRKNPLTGEMDYKAIQKARQQAQQIIAEKDSENMLNWEFLGPNNVGGRTRVLWIDPNNSNHLIAGGVSGGLWISNDGANNWTRHPQNFEFDNLATNCIVQGSDGAIYVGTGEIFAGYGYVGSGFPGYGILKSTDNGATFTQVPSTAPGTLTNPNGETWTSVVELAADPNENIVYAGTPDGIFVSINGGDFVSPAGAPSNADGLVYDMAIAPNGLLHAAIGSDYYQITHSGSGADITFTYTKKSGSSAGQIPTMSGRRRLEIAASDPNYLYIVSVSGAGCLDRVFQSTDGGNTWAVIGTGTPGFFDPAANGFGDEVYCQGSYDLALSILPSDPNVIFVAGITLWRWRQAEGWEQVSSLSEGNPTKYVHADIHNLYFDPNDAQKMYITSDGGIGQTINAVDDDILFSTRNRNYNVTQFYTVTGSWEGGVIGGTQDNGVQFVSFDGQNSKLSALEVLGGDGGDVDLSKTNLNIMFAGSPSNAGYIGRSSNGGAGFGCFFDEKINASQDDGNCVMDGGGNWVTPFYLWEDMPLYQSTGERKSQFITGTANGKVWLTNEALNLSSTPEWFLASTVSGSGSKTITAVSISKDGNYAVAATAAGRLMRIAIAENDTDYTVLQIASTVTGGGGGYITSVNFGNTNDVLVVTYGGYGTSGKIFMCDNFTTATTATALNFVSIQHNLPFFPVYSAIIDADNDNRVIAGTDLGVWLYDIAAQTWSPQIAGMGRVPAFEVRQEPMRDLNCHVLYVGSYGKGFWRATTLTNSGCDTELPVWSDINPVTVQSFSMVLFPMPMVQQATVQISLPTTAENLSISLFDLQGRQVSQMRYSNQSAGTHQFDLERGSLSAGIYLVSVNADGRQMTQKIVVQ